MPTSPTSPDQLDRFEHLLRERLHQLADHAPTAVPAPGEVRVSAVATAPRRRIAGIGATVALLAGGVGITTLSLQGAAQPGGADSPEAAVRELAGAFAAEDVLGMIDVTLPEEVSALRAVFDETTAEAKRLDLLSETFALDAIAGIEIEVSGLVLTTENLDSDLALVTTTAGRASASFDGQTFPFGRVFDGSEPRSASASSDADLAASPIGVVTVRRGERWYVSLGMSIADAIRQSQGQAMPAGSGIVPEGSASPEAAVAELYRRLAALDLDAAAALAAPGEGDVFRRYAGLWWPPAEQVIADVRNEGLALSLSGVELERTADRDGRVTLRPTAFVLEGTLPGSWESTSTAGPPRNPDWPTLVNDSASPTGGGWVLPAGVPVPETTAKLGPALESSAPEIQALFERGEFNSTWAEPDGRIAPFADDAGSSGSAPQPFRVERRDGCTTASGPLVAEIVSFSASVEDLGDGTYRSCGTGDFPGIAGALLLARGGGSLLNLPAVTVAEDGGEWFVSPIGTIAAQFLDELRDVPDGANVIDMPLVPFAVGAMPRGTLDAVLARRGEVPPACEAIVVVGAGGVPVVIADPPLAEVRACAREIWDVDDGSGVDAGEAPTPAPVVSVGPATPAPVTESTVVP